jgi:hypothetical protein
MLIDDKGIERQKITDHREISKCHQQSNEHSLLIVKIELNENDLISQESRNC